MSGYGLIITIGTCTVVLGNIISALMMMLYVSERFWNVNKYFICKYSQIVFEVLCILWIPTIWMLSGLV